jgi:hypothetical protein
MLLVTGFGEVQGSSAKEEVVPLPLGSYTLDPPSPDFGGGFPPARSTLPALAATARQGGGGEPVEVLWLPPPRRCPLLATRIASVMRFFARGCSV